MEGLIASKGEEERLEGVSDRMRALAAVMGAMTFMAVLGRAADPAEKMQLIQLKCLPVCVHGVDLCGSKQPVFPCANDHLSSLDEGIY